MFSLRSSVTGLRLAVVELNPAERVVVEVDGVEVKPEVPVVTLVPTVELMTACFMVRTTTVSKSSRLVVLSCFAAMGFFVTRS